MSGDYWQVLFAARSGERAHNLLLNAAGKRLLDGLPSHVVAATERKPGACMISVALPLSQIGVASGGHFHLNVVRRSGVSDDQPMWSPSFGEFEAPAALRELTPGQWCHVAATYDGATMRVYLNGREAGAGKSVTTAIRTNTEPLRFGWLGSYGFLLMGRLLLLETYPSGTYMRNPG